MTCLKPSLYASPVRSNAVSGPTEGHSGIARAIEPDGGATAKGRSWSWRLLRGTRDFRSDRSDSYLPWLVERNSIPDRISILCPDSKPSPVEFDRPYPATKT